jgi:hypothetical protein
MPDDVPPRPGAPGYDEFVAHGQPSNVAARPAATDVKPASAGVKTDAAPIPAQEQSANAPNAVQRGGVYERRRVMRSREIVVPAFVAGIDV